MHAISQQIYLWVHKQIYYEIACIRRQYMNIMYYVSNVPCTFDVSSFLFQKYLKIRQLCSLRQNLFDIEEALQYDHHHNQLGIWGHSGKWLNCCNFNHKSRYPIASYSFRGNYSFLNLEIKRSQNNYIRPKATVLFKGGNY